MLLNIAFRFLFFSDNIRLLSSLLIVSFLSPTLLFIKLSHYLFYFIYSQIIASTFFKGAPSKKKHPKKNKEEKRRKEKER